MHNCLYKIVCHASHSSIRACHLFGILVWVVGKNSYCVISYTIELRGLPCIYGSPRSGISACGGFGRHRLRADEVNSRVGRSQSFGSIPSVREDGGAGPRIRPHQHQNRVARGTRGEAAAMTDAVVARIERVSTDTGKPSRSTTLRSIFPPTAWWG